MKKLIPLLLLVSMLLFAGGQKDGDDDSNSITIKNMQSMQSISTDKVDNINFAASKDSAPLRNKESKNCLLSLFKCCCCSKVEE